MKKNIFVYAASLLFLGLGACSEEQEYAPQNDGIVKLTVYAAKGDTETRSLLSEENGNLKCEWTDGDQLLVTDANGSVKGTLNLTDKEAGKFEGDLLLSGDGKVTLKYFHFGTGADLAKVSQNYGFDISSQDGSIGSLGKYDALSTQAEISVIDGRAYPEGTLQLERHFSFAHFTLKLPEGVTVNGEPVTISGDNVITKATLGLANRAVTDQAAGAITVNPGGNSFYVNVIPAASVTPVFKVTINGKEYEGSLKTRDIAAGKFIRKNDSNDSGVIVDMTEPQPDEDPSNPGNTDHWGGDDIDPTWKDSGNGYTRVSWADGWTNNVASIEEKGGFCAPITYTSNGIKNGLLTSGTYAYFFQWGRWLGFPSNCAAVITEDGGSAEITTSNGQIPKSIFINGVNYYDTKIGYVWRYNNPGGTTYGACYSNWTPERANNCSIMFGMVTGVFVNPLDYVGDNENSKWEDRSGNPCPDGYRLPTASELEALIPTTGTVNGSYAEVKTVNGVKYAMQWKVNTTGSVPCVEIRSSKTNATNVSVDDAIFNNTKVVRLPAYGYLDNEANLKGRGKTGVYWSNESGTNEVNGTNGLGGKSLLIKFSGSKAEMAIYVAPRSFGGNVLPIKDPNAKTATLTPWLPLSGI